MDRRLNSAVMVLTVFSVSLAKHHGWYDSEGYQQLFCSRIGDFSPVNTVGRTGTTWDGGLSSGSACYLKGKNGYIAYTIAFPNTIGAVTLHLAYVTIAFPVDESRTYHFAIEVNRSTEAHSTAWERVCTDSARGIEAGQRFDLEQPAEAQHVRLVNLDDGWFNLREVDFYGIITEDAEAATFVHPGTPFTAEGVEKLKRWLADENHPAGVTFEELLNRWPARERASEAVPHFGADVQDGNIGAWELTNDNEAAYAQAIMWAVTGDETYARNIVNVIKGWPQTCTRVSGDALKLQFGLELGGMMQAAELLKGTWTGWNNTIEDSFTQWMQAYILPQTDFMNSMGDNWATNIFRTILAYTVLTENRYHFNRYIHTWKQHMAHRSTPWGETGETCRDMAHEQMSISGMVGAAEIAWAQGVDLYSWKDKTDDTCGYSIGPRLATVLEYHAHILNVGMDVEPFPTDAFNRIGWAGWIDNGHGDTITGSIGGVNGWGWEVGYNHYANRMNIVLPELQKRIDYMRDNNRRDGMIHSAAWGTITHAGLGDGTGGIVSVSPSLYGNRAGSASLHPANESRMVIFDLHGRAIPGKAPMNTRPNGIYLYKTDAKRF